MQIITYRQEYQVLPGLPARFQAIYHERDTTSLLTGGDTTRTSFVI